jgi:hypothetical protein
VYTEALAAYPIGGSRRVQRRNRQEKGGRRPGTPSSQRAVGALIAVYKERVSALEAPRVPGHFLVGLHSRLTERRQDEADACSGAGNHGVMYA